MPQRPPHKTRPLLLFRIYKPKYGGRKFAFRVGALSLYGVAVWNPYWLVYHPSAFFIHPRRIVKGVEVVFRLWKLQTTVRLQRLRFIAYHERLRIKGSSEAARILHMAAAAFSNHTFAKTHPYGQLDKVGKAALFWDAYQAMKIQEGDIESQDCLNKRRTL